MTPFDSVDSMSGEPERTQEFQKEKRPALSAEQRKESSGLRESLEEGFRLAEAYTGSVLEWMNTLYENTEIPGLSPELHRGATVPGVLLFTLMMGCASQEFRNCSNDEVQAFQSTLNWLNEHPDEIQAKMDELWPEQTVGIDDLLDSLNAATLVCSNRETKSAGARSHLLTNNIRIYVNDDVFRDFLSLYKEGKWTEDHGIDTIMNISKSSPEEYEVTEYTKYMTAIMYFANTLLHEAAHIATNELHGISGQREADQISEEYHFEVSDTYYDQAEIDQVYAWGSAAGLVAIEELKTNFDIYLDSLRLD